MIERYSPTDTDDSVAKRSKLYTGLLFDRLYTFFKKHDPRSNDEQLFLTAFCELVKGNEHCVLLYEVNSQGQLTSHAFMTLENNSIHGPCVYVHQTEVDKSNRTFMHEAIEYTKKLCIKYNLSQIVMNTKHNPKAWTKAYGFELVYHIMKLDLSNGDTDASTV